MQAHPEMRQIRHAPRPALVLGLVLGLGMTTTLLAAPPLLEACVNFGCRTSQRVALPASTWTDIERLFAATDTPADERNAIAMAIALLEREVGRRTGTSRDLAYNWQRAGEPGELDCIAESRNTSHYIATMENSRLLRWHRGLARVRRTFLLSTHWTAVIEDLTSGIPWAVDSWFRDNGEPPVILPLQDWYDRKEPAR